MNIGVVGLGFVAMLSLMFLSFPVAVAIVGVGAFGGYLFFGTPMVDMMGGVIWTSLNSPSILAIPLFMMLGELMLRGGIADRMYDALAVWLNRLPGGLLHTNIATCALFSATSGSSVATAATVGTIALPALEARGYRPGPSLGSLAAGGTLGILIPPSINLLVYGSLANVSVGQLFAAGLVPGIMLAGLFSLYILLFQGHNSQVESEPVPLRVKLAYLRFLFPPLLIFGIVMGSIYGGYATPTESAAIGVVVALLIIAINRRLSLQLLINCSMQAARTTGMTVIVLACALLLNVTISMLGATQAVTQWVATFDLGQVGLICVLIIFYLLLGMFMDAMSMLVLTVPITVPLVMSVGVDPIWFGIFIVLMCELALITPPVGMNLFIINSMDRETPMTETYKAVMYFVGSDIVRVVILVMFPAITLFLLP